MLDAPAGPLQGEGKCGLRADGREQSGAELLEEPGVASAQLQPHHELRLGGVDGGHLELEAQGVPLALRDEGPMARGAHL